VKDAVAAGGQAVVVAAVVMPAEARWLGETCRAMLVARRIANMGLLRGKQNFEVRIANSELRKRETIAKRTPGF